MIEHSKERALAVSAVALLEVILADMLKVIPDQQLPVEARVLAQVTAANIMRWDAGTDTVKISDPDRAMITGPMHLE